jgi:hypothetical protein
MKFKERKCSFDFYFCTWVYYAEDDEYNSDGSAKLLKILYEHL